MFGLGVPELIVIFVIALLVFGPKKLPDLGKSIGRAMAEFKKASDDFQDSVKTEMREVEKQVDLEEVKKLGKIDLSTESAYQEPTKTAEEGQSTDQTGESGESHERPAGQKSEETKNG
jgi:sec-independent protein translocase protein TatA